MALLTILTEPDPRLHVRAKPVDVVDNEIRQLMEDMLETMYANDGIGLAATQVGINKRVIVMDVEEDDNTTRHLLKMANPEILTVSEEKTPLNEGCLSVPELRAEVIRPSTVRVRYLDENNQLQEQEASGYLAKCIQHEIDHLNGILFIDHLSRLKREMMLKKLAKHKKLYR